MPEHTLPGTERDRERERTTRPRQDYRGRMTVGSCIEIKRINFLALQILIFCVYTGLVDRFDPIGGYSWFNFLSNDKKFNLLMDLTPITGWVPLISIDMIES